MHMGAIIHEIERVSLNKISNCSVLENFRPVSNDSKHWNIKVNKQASVSISIHAGISFCYMISETTYKKFCTVLTKNSHKELFFLTTISIQGLEVKYISKKKRVEILTHSQLFRPTPLTDFWTNSVLANVTIFLALD